MKLSPMARWYIYNSAAGAVLGLLIVLIAFMYALVTESKAPSAKIALDGARRPVIERQE